MARLTTTIEPVVLFFVADGGRGLASRIPPAKGANRDPACDASGPAALARRNQAQFSQQSSAASRNLRLLVRSPNRG